jgi:hypothetical protein
MLFTLAKMALHYIWLHPQINVGVVQMDLGSVKVIAVYAYAALQTSL